jgi:DNA-binding transcriptional MocR family regulator
MSVRQVADPAPTDLLQASALSTIAMLRASSLASAVQQEIERMIFTGELGPGDKLTEAFLAERLGVSRGPVREAFRVLEEAGLLQLEKNRGVFVRQIPIEEALEIFEPGPERQPRTNRGARKSGRADAGGRGRRPGGPLLRAQPGVSRAHGRLCRQPQAVGPVSQTHP